MLGKIIIYLLKNPIIKYYLVAIAIWITFTAVLIFSMPLPGQFYLRGKILEITSLNTLIVDNWYSSVLWDKSHIGDKNIVIQTENTEKWNVNDDVLLHGDINKQRGVIKADWIIEDRFQPFGVDWRITYLASLPIIFLVVPFFYFLSRS